MTMQFPRHLLAALLLLLATVATAQTNDNIRKLETQRSDIQKRIAEAESILKSTRDDVNGQLRNLALLKAQIEERRKLIVRLDSDIAQLDKEIRTIDKDIAHLGKSLEEVKSRYAKSLNFIRQNRNIQEQLLFIFSGKSLQNIYRRLRYLQEYSDFQKKQADEIVRQTEALKKRKGEKARAISEKNKTRSQKEAEQSKIEAQEKEANALVDQLRKKQSGLRAEIRKQKKKSDELNRKIDQLIKAEIERAKKREEEERRKQEAKSSAKKGSAAPKPAGDGFKKAKADKTLSDDFEKNKGILPVPVTGSYLVVNHFGQYNVPGLNNVTLDNKGIDLQTKPESMARSIFKGEVSAIFEYGGLKGVLVRHGKYISVYCNLSSVLVKRGDQVEAKQALGKIYTNRNEADRTVLHFQLRSEKTKLNPESWIDL